MSELTLTDAANDYLSRGLHIIALTDKMPNGKVHPHGIHDAFDSASDPEAISKAFNHPKTTGIGILTGGAAFVVDIDGEEGARAWLEIVGEVDLIPERWVAKTSRGYHLWFADEKSRKTRKLAPLLDLKGEGGYVAAPPSAHPDGGRYEWRRFPSEGAMLEPPDKLRKLLDEQDALMEQKMITRDQRKRVRHASREDGKWWASWGFEGVLKAVREAEPGTRNNVLLWAACSMAEDGATAEDYTQLHTAALESGLSDRETRLTIRSGRKMMVRG